MASFRRSLSQVLNANILGLIANAAMVFGLPFFLTPEDYGAWQLYQLYALLLGYITFGITDGIYLRYGGMSWADLPFKRVGSQFWALLAILTTLTVLAIAVVLGSAGSEPSIHVLAMCVALTSNLAFIPRTLITITFQATNRMLPYARITVLERMIALVVTYVAVGFGIRHFMYLILVDLLAKLVALAVSIAYGKELFCSGLPRRSVTGTETKDNLIAGLPVLLSNLSIVALPSVARLFIERGWSIEVFGSISIGFNLSNMLLVVVNAVAIALFPRLRRLDRGSLAGIHSSMETLISLSLGLFLVAAFPVSQISMHLLPAFSDGLSLLPVLLGVFVFDSLMRLLGANWLKVLRRERLLLVINVSSVLGGVVLMYVFYVVFSDVVTLLIGLLITVGGRAIWAEVAVRAALGVRLFPLSGLLTSLTLVTFLAANQLPWIAGMILYAFALALQGVILRRRLTRSFEEVRTFVRS